MKWLTNIYDPNLPKAERYVVPDGYQTEDEAWEEHLRWLEGKVIGEPMPNEHQTVDEMKAKGLVGVYKAVAA